MELSHRAALQLIGVVHDAEDRDEESVGEAGADDAWNSSEGSTTNTSDDDVPAPPVGIARQKRKMKFCSGLNRSTEAENDDICKSFNYMERSVFASFSFHASASPPNSRSNANLSHCKSLWTSLCGYSNLLGHERVSLQVLNYELIWLR